MGLGLGATLGEMMGAAKGRPKFPLMLTPCCAARSRTLGSSWLARVAAAAASTSAPSSRELRLQLRFDLRLLAYSTVDWWALVARSK